VKRSRLNCRDLLLTGSLVRQITPSPMVPWGRGLTISPDAKVRYAAHFGLRADIGVAPKSATNGLMHRSKKHLYSITSSAAARNMGDGVIRSLLAVVKLISSVNLTACSIGSSAGFAP
jgi:hypothetical protein